MLCRFVEVVVVDVAVVECNLHEVAENRVQKAVFVEKE